MIEKKGELYDVDFRQTIEANIFWVIGIFFLIFVIVAWEHQIQYLENEVNRLLYLIIGLFVIIKLVGWIGQPYIHFKSKKE